MLKSDLRGIEMNVKGDHLADDSKLKSDLRGIEITLDVKMLANSVMVKIRP